MHCCAPQDGAGVVIPVFMVRNDMVRPNQVLPPGEMQLLEAIAANPGTVVSLSVEEKGAGGNTKLMPEERIAATAHFRSSHNASEGSCADVANGSCARCTGGTADECEAVECHPNYFDDDNLPSTGCEATCAPVHNGGCVACEGSSVGACTSVLCDATFYDSDKNASNGCESTCATINNAESCVWTEEQGKWCRVIDDAKRSQQPGPPACKAACEASPGCVFAAWHPLNTFECTTGTSCELASGSTAASVFHRVCQDMPTDDCQAAGCVAVPHGNCTECTDSTLGGCMAIECDGNRFNSNNDASDGCETGCPTVAGGTCNTCSGPSTCSTWSCDANQFDANEDPGDGCEATCVQIPRGRCTSCINTTTAGCATFVCNSGFVQLPSDVVGTSLSTLGCHTLAEICEAASSCPQRRGLRRRQIPTQ